MNSQNIISEKREVQKFHSIKLSVNGNIIVTLGKPQEIFIKTDNKVLTNLKIEVNKGELEISLKALTSVKSLVIEIAMEELDNLTINGSGSIEVKDEMNIKNLNFAVNGNGSITTKINSEFFYGKIFGSGKMNLSGKAISTEMEISGSGNILATELESETAKIKLNAAGVAKLNASNNITIDIVGAGEVKYTGTPKIKAKITGSGTIEAL